MGRSWFCLFFVVGFCLYGPVRAKAALVFCCLWCGVGLFSLVSLMCGVLFCFVWSVLCCGVLCAARLNGSAGLLCSSGLCLLLVLWLCEWCLLPAVSRLICLAYGLCSVLVGGVGRSLGLVPFSWGVRLWVAFVSRFCGASVVLSGFVVFGACWFFSVRGVVCVGAGGPCLFGCLVFLWVCLVSPCGLVVAVRGWGLGCRGWLRSVLASRLPRFFLWSVLWLLEAFFFWLSVFLCSVRFVGFLWSISSIFCFGRVWFCFCLALFFFVLRRFACVVVVFFFSGFP